MTGPKVTLTRITPLLPDVKRTSKQNAVMLRALRYMEQKTTCHCPCCRATEEFAGSVIKEVEKL